MPKYRVIAEFVDLEASLRRLPGETVEAPLERAKVLIDKGVIYPAPLEEREETKVQPSEVPEETKVQPSEVPEKDSAKTDSTEKPGRSKAKAK